VVDKEACNPCDLFLGHDFNETVVSSDASNIICTDQSIFTGNLRDSPNSSLFIDLRRSIGQRFVRLVLIKIGDQQALVSMSAAVATMRNVCCASSSGIQMLQSAYGFPRTFLRLCSQRHANVNSSRLVAVGRSVPARQLIIHSSISTTGVCVTPLMLSD
jgi:hypothetical protein